MLTTRYLGWLHAIAPDPEERTALVAAEVALALGLLISAALLVRTAQNVTRADLGFETTGLLTFELSLDERKYATDAAVRGFYERLVRDLRSGPRIVDAAAGSFVPFGAVRPSVVRWFGAQRSPNKKRAGPFAGIRP